MSPNSTNASGGRIRRHRWFTRGTTTLITCGLITATAISAHGSTTVGKTSRPRTAPQQQADCPEHTHYVFIGVRGVYSPPEVFNPERPQEVGFIRDNVIPEIRDAVGAENLTMEWLPVAPPKFSETFGQTSTINQAVLASFGIRPSPLELPEPLLDGRDRARDAIVSTLNRYAECKNNRFILAAHSLGAWGVGEALADETPPRAGAVKLLNRQDVLSRIDQVLLWGDPRFDSSADAARRPTDLDQAGPPTALGVASAVLGPRKPYLPEELKGRAQSYCWGGPGPVDPVCASFEAPKGSTGTVSPSDWAEGMAWCGVEGDLLSRAFLAAGGAGQLGAITFGTVCGHTRYTGGYAREYTLKLTGEGLISLRPVAKAVTVTVSSTASAHGGWRDTTLPVKKGQKVKITHLSGSWTVDKDNTHLKPNRVGPAGYPSTTNAEPSECKLDDHLPSGQLLAGVGEFRSPVSYAENGDVGTFTAPADGTVSLTINDTCRENNAGLISVRVELAS
ncbi:MULTISPECIES: hypothetical protein [Streptomyces]|uniref:Cutinase n=2 Tax=Streptomyces TaxID=1883 RepID=A0ABV9J704_9ACTN